MATTRQNKHLTLADREQIETGIRNNATKRKMAASLGKDGSTIGKEIAKRRLPKKQALLYKKRADRRYLKNRTYQDYLNALVEEPDLQIVQMDIVYHEVQGPFILTFKFLTYDCLVALYHETKTAEAMLSGIDRLESILGPQLFRELVLLLLTDRGTEFSAVEAMETSNDNTNRTRVFYCDPMASGQKGSLEKRHAELRYIVPKQVSLRTLGLHNQAKLNLALSHVNSVPGKPAQGKTPFELLRFYQPEMVRRLEALGITEVPKDQVRLNPDLLH